MRRTWMIGLVATGLLGAALIVMTISVALAGEPPAAPPMPTAEQLIQQLRQNPREPEMRIKAAELMEFVLDPKKVAAAAAAGERVDTKAAEAALEQALKDEDPVVRFCALSALATIRSDPMSLLPALRPALASASEELRLHAARHAGKKEYKDIIDQLAALESDSNDQVRKAAARALGDMLAVDYPNNVAGEGLRAGDPGYDAAVAALLAALKDKSGEVRSTVVLYGLCKAVPVNMEVARGLVAATGDNERWVRESAFSALRSICLKDKDKEQPFFKLAEPVLFKGLSDEGQGTRRMCIWALLSDRQPSETAVAAVAKMMMDEDWLVREAAVNALGKCGPDAKTAVPQILAGLGDAQGRAGKERLMAGATPENVSRLAATNLAKIGPDAVPALITAAGGDDKNVRLLAIDGLGTIGPAAKAAIPSLEKAQADKDEFIQKAAAAALKAIKAVPLRPAAAMLSDAELAALYDRYAKSYKHPQGQSPHADEDLIDEVAPAVLDHREFFRDRIGDDLERAEFVLLMSPLRRVYAAMIVPYRRAPAWAQDKIQQRLWTELLTPPAVSSSPDLARKRDRLLAEADAKLRQGLRDLAAAFPQMATADQKPLDDALKAMPHQPGRLSIDLCRGTREMKPTVGDNWRLMAVVRPPLPEDARYASDETMLWPFSLRLDLVGHWWTAAGDPKLNAALDKLLKDALTPLKALAAEAGEETTGLGARSDTPAALAALMDFPIEFVATRKAIDEAGKAKPAPGALVAAVEKDQNFQLTLAVESVTVEGTPIQAGRDAVLAIQSAEYLLGTPPAQAIGKRHRFRLIWNTNRTPELSNLVVEEYGLLPPALEKKRDDLLAQVARKLRTGITDLARTFPQLAQAEGRPLAEVIAERSDSAAPRSGHAGLTLSRRGINKVERPAAPEDWMVMARLQPAAPQGRRLQVRLEEYCPHLNLEGMWHASATDPKLQAALQKLLDDALSPLKALDREAGGGRANAFGR